MGKEGDFIFVIGVAAKEFSMGGLILWRDAFDGGCHVAPQKDAGHHRCWSMCVDWPVLRGRGLGIKAGRFIAGKEAAGAIASLDGRGKTCDEEPRMGIAKAGHRFSPVQLIGKGFFGGTVSRKCTSRGQSRHSSTQAVRVLRLFFKQFFPLAGDGFPRILFADKGADVFAAFFGYLGSVFHGFEECCKVSFTISTPKSMPNSFREGRAIEDDGDIAGSLRAKRGDAKRLGGDARIGPQRCACMGIVEFLVAHHAVVAHAEIGKPGDLGFHAGFLFRGQMSPMFPPIVEIERGLGEFLFDRGPDVEEDFEASPVIGAVDAGVGIIYRGFVGREVDSVPKDGGVFCKAGV